MSYISGWQVHGTRFFYLCFFFFSSRRRHTRYWRDWSSDVCSSDLPYLKNGRLQRTDVVNNRIIYRIDSVKSDAEAHHIELGSGKAFDACRIADVAQYLMRKSRLQFLRALLEQFDLPTGESVEPGVVAAHKMGEYRAGNHRILVFQAADELRYLIDGKPEPMHSRIQLHVDGEIGDSFFLRRLNQRVEQMEIVNFGLQLIIEQGFERCCLRIHDDDGSRDACFPQLRTFIRHGYRKIIGVMFLQRFGYFVRTRPVSGGFHHADYLRFRAAKHRTVVVQVGYHRAEIHFQYGFVHLQFQRFRKQIEVKHSRTFQQNGFRMQTFQKVGRQQRLRVGEEIPFGQAFEAGLARRNLRPHSYQFVYSATLHQLCHPAIKSCRALSGFQYVRQDERALQPFFLGAAHEEIERDVQRNQVGIIAVVDQHTGIFAFLHFEPHGYRLQTCHAFGDLLDRKSTRL